MRSRNCCRTPREPASFASITLLWLVWAIFFFTSGCGFWQATSIHEKHLKNGATLIYQSEPHQPLVGITCFFRLGPREESSANAGITQLALEVASKGTRSHTAREFAEALEALGADIASDVSSDYAMLQLSAPKKTWEKAHALFLEILTEPLFPTAEVSTEKGRLIASIRASHDDPFDYAYEKLQMLLWGSHSYGLPKNGTIQSVTQLQRNDVLNWFRVMREPENLVISCSGDISLRKLDRVYRSLSSGPTSVKDVQLNAPTPKYFPPKKLTLQKRTSSAWILQSYPLHTKTISEYAAAKVLATILGGGMSSRIFIALREEKGLTYSTGAFFPTRVLGSHFVFYASSPKGNVPKISAAIPWLIRKWKKEKFKDNEVESAIEKVLGDHLRAHETTLARSWYPGWHETIGWGKDFDTEFRTALRKVTPGDLQKILNRFPAKAHSVIVTPEK